MNNWTYDYNILFIFLHDSETKREIMINPKSIEMIDGNRIYFHGYAITVVENYEEIKKIITEAFQYK